MKLHKLINIVMDKVFKKYFAWFKGQDPKSNLFNLPTDHN